MCLRRSRINRCDCQTIFHRLPIRPARPILGAVSPQGQLVLGLPGNPVSAAVGMTKFGLPLLAKMSGNSVWQDAASASHTQHSVISDIAIALVSLGQTNFWWTSGTRDDSGLR